MLKKKYGLWLGTAFLLFFFAVQADAIESTKTSVTQSYNCLNDDSITAVDVKPEGPVYVTKPDTGNFALTSTSTVSWSEGDCSPEAMCNNPDGFWTDPAGCGTLDTSTCIYATSGVSAGIYPDLKTAYKIGTGAYFRFFILTYLNDNSIFLLKSKTLKAVE